MKKLKMFSFVLIALLGVVLALPCFALQSTVMADEANEITIESNEQFVSVLSNPSNYSKTIKLTSDLNLEGVDLAGIYSTAKTFSGTFDGNGYSLSNLTLSSSGDGNYGLFPTAENATIKNLKITGTTTVKYNGENDCQIGVVVGKAIRNVSIDKCQVGQADGNTLSTIKTDASSNFALSARFNFGAVAGRFEDGSTLTSCIAYLQGNFNYTTSESLQNTIHIGGLVGTNSNSTILANAVFSRYTITCNSSNIQFYVGGICGQLADSNFEVINNIYAGTVVRDSNDTNAVVGSVAGYAYKLPDDSRKISCNFFESSDGMNIVGTTVEEGQVDQSNKQATINANFIRNTQNWNSTKLGWDFTTTWNWKTGARLLLQVFQSFTYSFSPQVDNNQGIVESVTFDGASETKQYKFGTPVTIEITYKPENIGYYSLQKNNITVTPTALSATVLEDGVTLIEKQSDNLTSGYTITFMASDATDGTYSFIFDDIKYSGEAVVATVEGESFARGGLRFLGGSNTTTRLPIQDLTKGSSVQIESVANGIYTPERWELYTLQGEEYVKDTTFSSSAQVLTFRFGEGHFKGYFRLVAYYTDAEALEIGFTGFDANIITNIVLNSVAYDGENPIKVPSSGTIELSFDVADGYEFDDESFINFLSNRYGGDDASLLHNYNYIQNEDGSSSYRFSNISTDSLKKYLDDRSTKTLNFELHSIVKEEEDKLDLTWLWITLPIVGVLIIAGGIVAFIMIRRRNVQRRLNGGENGGNNQTKNKVKKTKAKEVDYKDYYS